MKETKEERFDHTFRAYYRELIHFAMQYLGDMETSRDVVSMVFEDIWCNLDSLRSDNLRALLYRMVRCKCVDLLRQQKVRRNYAELVQKLSKPYTEKDMLAEQDYKMKLIRQVLSRLEPRTLEIFKACYLDEKKYLEVANELNISKSTVKKHIVKALRILRAHNSRQK